MVARGNVLGEYSGEYSTGNVLEETFGGKYPDPPCHYADRTSYDGCDMQSNNFVYASLLQLKKSRSRGRLEKKKQRMCN